MTEKMHILVTGGTGYIGSLLIKDLVLIGDQAILLARFIVQ